MRSKVIEEEESSGFRVGGDDVDAGDDEDDDVDAGDDSEKGHTRCRDSAARVDMVRFDGGAPRFSAISFGDGDGFADICFNLLFYIIIPSHFNFIL